MHMNREKYHQIFALGALVLLLACKTTDSYKRTDSKANTVEIISTSDERSALEKPRADKSLVRTKENLRKELETTPNRTQGWINLANLELASGNLEAAENACRSALRTDIKNKPAKKILAQIALRRGQIDLAQILINEFTVAGKLDSQVLNLQALIALKRNEPNRAFAFFKRALELEPGNISVRLNLGVLNLKYRQFQAAAVQYERVLKLMPNNTDAKLHLAIVRTAQGKNEQAQSLLNQVLAVQKDNPLALYNIAVVYKNMEHYDEALDNLKTYLKTATGKSSETDQAFALIENIKDLAAQSGKNAVSDEDIQGLAKDLESRPQTQVARAEEKMGEDDRSEDETKAQKPEKLDQKAAKQSNEIEDLENELTK